MGLTQQPVETTRRRMRTDDQDRRSFFHERICPIDASDRLHILGYSS